MPRFTVKASAAKSVVREELMQKVHEKATSFVQHGRVLVVYRREGAELYTEDGRALSKVRA